MHKRRSELGEKKDGVPSYDLSIGSFAKDLLPKNPFTTQMTTVLVAGFMMIYMSWVWVPPLLFLGLMILIWNLGHWCMRCLKNGLESFDGFFDEEK